MTEAASPTFRIVVQLYGCAGTEIQYNFVPGYSRQTLAELQLLKRRGIPVL